jgi:hypothetical protein
MNTTLSTNIQDDLGNIDDHVNRIRESGILARSNNLKRLFEYLYACHQSGKSPKESEWLRAGHDSCKTAHATFFGTQNCGRGQ